jgi:hypothetical protein
MTVHTTTVSPFAYGRRITIPTCPQCDDTLVAPTTAAFDGAGCVHHIWTCDQCGLNVDKVRHAAGRMNLARL